MYSMLVLVLMQALPHSPEFVFDDLNCPLNFESEEIKIKCED